jgi:hypothetical protein
MRSAGIEREATIDSMSEAAYPNSYDLLTRHRGYVLLLPDAGMWVGTRRESSHPPGESGWVLFFSAFKSWELGGLDFEIFMD